MRALISSLCRERPVFCVFSVSSEFSRASRSDVKFANSDNNDDVYSDKSEEEGNAILLRVDRN